MFYICPKLCCASMAADGYPPCFYRSPCRHPLKHCATGTSDVRILVALTGTAGGWLAVPACHVDGNHAVPHTRGLSPQLHGAKHPQAHTGQHPKATTACQWNSAACSLQWVVQYDYVPWLSACKFAAVTHPHHPACMTRQSANHAHKLRVHRQQR
jgi:hypothetical protein